MKIFVQLAILLLLVEIHIRNFGSYEGRGWQRSLFYAIIAIAWFFLPDLGIR